MLKENLIVISEDQIQQFEETGYVVLQNIISPELLIELRDLFDTVMADDQIQKTANIVNGKNYISNIDKIMGLHNLACLEALGSPAINEVAKSICGDDYFMIQEFGVIKMLGDNTPVLWHQDMVHSRNVKCFTMGIYLDDADAENGALCFVPKSHTSGKSICELQNEPHEVVPVNAGEILIHDMMAAHHSAPLTSNSIRRVLYFEFLNTEQVMQENIYNEAIINNRKQLLSLAKDYYLHKHNQSGTLSVETIQQQLAEINSFPIQAKPSFYCLEFGDGQKAIFGVQ